MSRSPRSRRESFFVPEKIVSGGQTGVDRGALDAAIAVGIDHGGWCPAGRLAEDGTVPSCYVLMEWETAYYPDRTAQNVIDTDATLILYRDVIRGGTLLTRRVCRRHRKPLVCVALGDAEAVVAIVNAWLADVRPAILNVAGPRESQQPGIQAETARLLTRILARSPK